MRTNDTDEHGPAAAYYLNGPIGLLPQFECLCGWLSNYGCRNWEEAGEEFDEHLEDA